MTKEIPEKYVPVAALNMAATYFEEHNAEAQRDPETPPQRLQQPVCVHFRRKGNS